MTFAPVSSLTAFAPQNITFSPDPSQFLIQITRLISDYARFINLREIAIYDLTETVIGEQWFNTNNPTVAQNSVKRIAYRQVYNIAGPIAAGATKTVAHGITGASPLTFTHVYGMATTATDQRPMPYASATLVTNQIEIKVDNTNITIINGSTAPSISSAIVVLEYLKN